MISSTDDQIRFLSVSTGMKVLMLSVSGLLLTASVWLVLHRLWSGTDIGVTLFIFLIFSLPSGWMFQHLLSLCSIKLDRKGISQLDVFVGKRRHLRWEEVEQVSFRKFSFFFEGKNGERLELNTALFNDAAKTISKIRIMLPPRLLAQLD